MQDTHIFIRKGSRIYRWYPLRYLYGLLQRFRQFRDQREERVGGGGEGGGEENHDRSSAQSVSLFYQILFEVHNCLTLLHTKKI